MAESPHEYVDPSDITKEDVISAFLQTIQRTINCLSAEEAKIRRTAIERLHIYLLKDDAAGSLPPADVLQRGCHSTYQGSGPVAYRGRLYLERNCPRYGFKDGTGTSIGRLRGDTLAAILTLK